MRVRQNYSIDVTFTLTQAGKLTGSIVSESAGNSTQASSVTGVDTSDNPGP